MVPKKGLEPYTLADSGFESAACHSATSPGAETLREAGQLSATAERAARLVFGLGPRVVLACAAWPAARSLRAPEQIGAVVLQNRRRAGADHRRCAAGVGAGLGAGRGDEHRAARAAGEAGARRAACADGDGGVDAGAVAARRYGHRAAPRPAACRCAACGSRWARWSRSPAETASSKPPARPLAALPVNAALFPVHVAIEQPRAVVHHHRRICGLSRRRGFANPIQFGAVSVAVVERVRGLRSQHYRRAAVQPRAPRSRFGRLVLDPPQKISAMIFGGTSAALAHVPRRMASHLIRRLGFCCSGLRSQVAAAVAIASLQRRRASSHVVVGERAIVTLLLWACVAVKPHEEGSAVSGYQGSCVVPMGFDSVGSQISPPRSGHASSTEASRREELVPKLLTASLEASGIAGSVAGGPAVLDRGLHLRQTRPATGLGTSCCRAARRAAVECGLRRRRTTRASRPSAHTAVPRRHREHLRHPQNLHLRAPLAAVLPGSGRPTYRGLPLPAGGSAPLHRGDRQRPLLAAKRSSSEQTRHQVTRRTPCAPPAPSPRAPRTSRD